MATHSFILAWEIPWTEELWGYEELDTTEHLSTAQHNIVDILGKLYYHTFKVNFQKRKSVSDFLKEIIHAYYQGPNEPQ